jgi:hypothetical protein
MRLRTLTSNRINMKTNLTLTNDFHNTSANLRATVLWHGMHCEVSLTAHQMKRAARKLCGVTGCTCGGPAGIRGRQEFNGKKLVVNVFPIE